MSNYRPKFKENYFYHVYNRGYMKQKLFKTPYDYQKFIDLYDQCKKEYPMVDIYLCCILPNHFHLLLQQTTNGLYISQFMKNLQGSFANYFKIKYDNQRGQPIFEGRFKAKIIETNDYLSQVYTYIKENPIKHNLVTSIDKRPYLFLERPVSLL